MLTINSRSVKYFNLSLNCKFRKTHLKFNSNYFRILWAMKSHAIFEKALMNWRMSSSIKWPGMFAEFTSCEDFFLTFAAISLFDCCKSWHFVSVISTKLHEGTLQSLHFLSSKIRAASRRIDAFNCGWMSLKWKYASPRKPLITRLHPSCSQDQRKNKKSKRKRYRRRTFPKREATLSRLTINCTYGNSSQRAHEEE